MYKDLLLYIGSWLDCEVGVAHQNKARWLKNWREKYFGHKDQHIYFFV